MVNGYSYKMIFLTLESGFFAQNVNDTYKIHQNMHYAIMQYDIDISALVRCVRGGRQSVVVEFIRNNGIYCVESHCPLCPLCYLICQSEVDSWHNISDISTFHGLTGSSQGSSVGD